MVVNELYYGPVWRDSIAPIKAESSGIAISDDIIAAALRNIYSRDFNPTTDIEPHLFREVAKMMAGAVAATVPGDSSLGNDPFFQALRHSTDVFSAFKVHRAQNDMAARLLDSNGNIKPFEQWRDEVLPIADHQCHTWLETEYNTAVLRARQAANWQQFLAEKDILPNLKWLPSTSPNPGADHRPFWNTILPIDHPFWDQHRPGDRWNCKCDLTSTDEPPTPVPDPRALPSGSPEGSNPQPGLKDNPGKTQAVFSDDHPYFPADCKHCPFYKPGVKARLATVITARIKDCYHCPYIDGCINEVGEQQKRLLQERQSEYHRLLNDPDYKNVQFDEKTGGVYAEHRLHSNQDNSKDLFFGNMTGIDLEKEFADIAFHKGHSVIMRQEGTIRGIINKIEYFNRELDTLIDGRFADIASVTKNKESYEYKLLKKNGQLAEFNVQHGTNADTVILYFHDQDMYSETRIHNSIEELCKLHKFAIDENGNVIKDENGNQVYTDELYEILIKHIICVTKTGIWKEFHL